MVQSAADPGGGGASEAAFATSKPLEGAKQKFYIGAANMRLGYYLGQWGDAVPAASGRTCVPPEGPEGPLGAELLCWWFRLPASFSSRWLAATHFRPLCSLLEPSSSTLLSLRSTVDFF